jgi:hypothetical protein
MPRNTLRDTLRDDRSYAGRRYADAAAELRRSFIELAAIDMALAEIHRTPLAAPSFPDCPDPAALRHPDFLPIFGGDWLAEAAARRDQLLGKPAVKVDPETPAAALPGGRRPMRHRQLRGYWGR